ncbi:twin-arginine translocation signal domain-containing protein [Haloarcula amylovorans]|uniref:twin-arginine translocation signal domain-containing protein n=1 Tax=Haloarcula amylovorans TaxID=2562280 RepID=UPI00107676D4|nr:twin-arginine translocation signal domain-containing protein [Halomicroarcula amylolytica]
MNRRKALKHLGALGGMSVLAGCGSVGAFQSPGGVTIKFDGDAEPNEQRTISISIGTYDPQVALESGSAPPEWRQDVRFQTLYRVTPGEQLQPNIFIDEPGQYRFDVWVEDRGAIGTEVTITAKGELAEQHTIVISSEGLQHEQS